MHQGMHRGIRIAALLLVPIAGVAQPPAGAGAFLKVCGTCHRGDGTGQRRTRAQWQENINSMIARGAKGSDQNSR